MESSMKKIALFTGYIARFSLWLSGFGLILMTGMIAAQVFYRYVLNDSIQWTEPASVMIMGWFIFLGAAVGIREGYHLSFDVLLYVLPQKTKLFLYSLSDVIVTCFGLGMIVYGWQLAEKTASNKLPTLGISGAYDFAPIVGGGILIVFFSIERVARRAAGLPTARFGDDTTVD